jgi:hypothetical protein
MPGLSHARAALRATSGNGATLRPIARGRALAELKAALGRGRARRGGRDRAHRGGRAAGAMHRVRRRTMPLRATTPSRGDESGTPGAGGRAGHVMAARHRRLGRVRHGRGRGTGPRRGGTPGTRWGAVQGGRGRAALGRVGASAMAGEAGPRARKGQGRLGRAGRARRRGRAGADAPGPARPSRAAAEAGGHSGHTMATMSARLEHGGGRRGDTKLREEGGEGGRQREDRGSPRAVGRRAASGEPGWGRGGRARWGGERSCARRLGKGEGDFGGGGLAGGHRMAGRRRLQPPTHGAARAQGEGGWAARGAWGRPRLGRRAGPRWGRGASWAARPWLGRLAG